MRKASASAAASAIGNDRRVTDPPDLQTQLESLLDQVWRCEADWRLYDRIDAFCASQPDHCGVQATVTTRSDPMLGI
jgi:hypothetical protein